MSDGITRDELREALRRELDREFQEQSRRAAQARRWTVRRVLAPDVIGGFLVSLVLVAGGGAALWINTQRDIQENAEAIRRVESAQEESARFLNARIDSERAARLEQNARTEQRLTEKIDAILDEIKEQRQDIKSIIRALPRPGADR